MHKIFVNAIGLEDPFILNAWNWIRTQIVATENIELCHNEESKKLFLQVPYFWNHNNLENINNIINDAEEVIISDLLNYDNNYNYVWQNLLSKIVHPHITCITNNRLLHLHLPQHRVIFYDFLFNRTKLYYFDKSRIQELIQTGNYGFWLYEGAEHYVLNQLNQSKQIKKTFLSLTRILQNLRRIIVEHLTKNHLSKGYIACHNLGMILDTNYTKGYCPVPNQYYDETFVSIYCESTSMHENIFHATEKTFEPLLKGNFILPYSNSNFVSNLKKYYGFRTPDILDYSYDSIFVDKLDVDPDNNRVQEYLLSINKICKFNIKELQEYYKDQFDIVQHNREVVASTPYDTLIEKLWQ